MSVENGFTPLVQTLTENKDVLADIADASLEAAEAIPVFGWAVKAWNVKNTFQAAKLYRNTKQFIESTSITDAQKFIDRFSSEEEKSELCDSLIQVLIDSEKPIKAHLASRLLNSIYDGKITVSTANELLLIILNSSVPALTALELFYYTNPQGLPSNLSPDVQTHGPLLVSMGIARIHGSRVSITDLGKALYKYAFM
ncbi:TPA: hypothetical protein MYQ99_003178 [Klebsiella pneumoniae]|uniref:hypothetical protein n=1 Tax=Klebsiella pneumoniae TaxID=573 RepID=UPI000C1F726C|nr:hypothetical protein [Klebsiella pneumoniae]MBC4133575.1 hypothetical protein [Klebsiella pneumoniae]HCB1990534.1 hypothetical protein [Klebsiella pneumoniae]